MTKVNILGTEYTYMEDDLNNPDLALNDGICFIGDKEIVVRRKEFMNGATEKSREYRYRHVIRHELIHAFAEESGVSYGDNEKLVDWIAHMIPYINKAVCTIEMQENHK